MLDETTPLLVESEEIMPEDGEVAGEGEVLVVEKPGALANHFDVSRSVSRQAETDSLAN